MMNADAHAIATKLTDVYRDIRDKAMNDMPICNRAIAVEAVGFREFEGYILGVIVTPWFANLVVAASSALTGASRLQMRFPAGHVEFNVSELEDFGRIASCSLFSPMFEFANHDSARAAALAALNSLFDPNLHAAPIEKSSTRRQGLDRRAFFGGRHRQVVTGDAS